MSPNEAKAHVRILRAVAVADREIVSAKRLAIGVLGGEETVEGRRLLDLETALERIGSNDARRTTFAAAVAIASVDGECNAAEEAVLERIRRAFRVVGQRHLALAEEEWRERLRASRAALADADTRFLRRIGDLNGMLSLQTYVSWVEELRAQRAGILRGTLAPLMAFDGTRESTDRART